MDRPSSDLLGHRYDIAFAEGDPVRLILDEAVKESRHVGPKDVFYERGDQPSRIVRMNTTELSGDDDKPAGVLLQAHDVTEWLALERRVQAAEKLAALHTLSAGVAHELRNPLSAVDLNLHLLEEELKERGVLAGQDVRYLHILNAECRRLSTILDNFMKLARSGSISLHKVDVKALIDHVAALMKFEAEERKIRLEQSVEPDLPLVLGDETQITQVLVNIIVNAFHAMPNGGLCQIAAAKREVDGSAWLEIAVKDNGGRHHKGSDAALVRAVLYDQNGRDRAGARHCVSHRTGSWRHDSDIERIGERNIGCDAIARCARATAGRRSRAVTSTAHILVVDDEVNIRNALSTLLEKRGYDAKGIGTAEEAFRYLEETPADLVITDVRMPGMDGIEFLRRLKDKWPSTEVVIMTAFGSIDAAVEAMRLGAYDYLTKPVDRERFPMVVEKALERHALVSENKQLRDRLETRFRFDQLVGKSESMQRIYGLVEMVADSDVTVLLTGESGTGKEVVARAIHHKSPRADRPFVTVNCGALPDDLFESELFGYEKGAFTGAVATKIGRFELAHRGTLLLDEIGELSLKSQVDFLRVLETKEFRRLGGTKVVKVDARIIAATNRNLEEAVKQGEFRGDLFYRLNVVPIKLPPLRERVEDIPLLIETFLPEFCAQHNRAPKAIAPEAMRLLRLYSWPGNIRQLRNLLERLVITVRESTIGPEHLPEEIQASREDARTMVVTLGTSLEEIEKEVIRRTLVEVTNHREKAAKLLGISLRAFQYKIKEYRIRE